MSSFFQTFAFFVPGGPERQRGPVDLPEQAEHFDRPLLQVDRRIWSLQ